MSHAILRGAIACDQVQHLRGTCPDARALRQALLIFGEHAITAGFEMRRLTEPCLANPATRTAGTDDQALDPHR